MKMTMNEEMIRLVRDNTFIAQDALDAVKAECTENYAVSEAYLLEKLEIAERCISSAIRAVEEESEVK